MGSFSCGKRQTFSHHVQGNTTADNVHHVLRLHDRFGFGSAIGELAVVHDCMSPSYLVDLSGGVSTLCVMSVFLGTLSNVASNPLESGEFGLLSGPLAFLHNVSRLESVLGQ